MAIYYINFKILTMKKRNLKSLNLNKKSISSLNDLKGAAAVAGAVEAAITPVSLNKTKCTILGVAITPITPPPTASDGCGGGGGGDCKS